MIKSSERNALNVESPEAVKIAVKLAARLLSIKVVTPGVDVNRGRASRVTGHLGVKANAEKTDAAPKL